MVVIIASVALAAAIHIATMQPVDPCECVEIEDAPELSIPTELPLRTLAVRATAYVATGNRTATGTVPHWGTVAVDPRVIPLGTRMLISGFDTVFIAEDTGGGVRGNHIDIFFLSYYDAIQFGVQNRTVTILR